MPPNCEAKFLDGHKLKIRPHTRQRKMIVAGNQMKRDLEIDNEGNFQHEENAHCVPPRMESNIQISPVQEFGIIRDENSNYLCSIRPQEMENSGTNKSRSKYFIH